MDAEIIIGNIPNVIAGEAISIPYTVTNTGNVSHGFGVGCEIRQGNQVKVDLGSQYTTIISPENSYSNDFDYSIPADWETDTYTARTAVWSGEPGSSTWLASYDRNFQVIEGQLDLTGRLIYHSYSGYLATPLDEIDGNIFVYSLDDEEHVNITSQLPVQNAMNAHFSPDGSRITFMAIPQNSARAWSNLEIYVYNIAKNKLVRLTDNSIADEDPKFHPNGTTLVFKRNLQVCTMNLLNQDVTQLTSSQDEKSGPNYSQDGSKIVYWSGVNENADIWWINSNGSGAEKLVGQTGIHDYYPIFRNQNNILFTRSEPSDNIYNYNIFNELASPAQFNQDGVEDSDPFPINAELIGFSSQRAGGKGGWDVFIGNPDNGNNYSIQNINSTHHDLGGAYSPYKFARSVVLLNPLEGEILQSNQSYLVRVKAWSDGISWLGASTEVIFEGNQTFTYSGLHDDGLNGDASAGDGVYSLNITVPDSPDDYLASTTAISYDNGLQNNLVSEVKANITIKDPTSIENIDSPILPDKYSLKQNCPNPFNPNTKIEFALPRSSDVEITVYNIMGQTVRILVNKNQTAGYKSVTWNGKNDDGADLSSGVYFYRIIAGNYCESKKMILLK